MVFHTADDVAMHRLMRFLGLPSPSLVTGFTLVVKSGEIPNITVTMYSDSLNLLEGTVEKTYRLVAIEPEGNP
jgi:hypothetical protein